jgi:hypothetical protein
VWGEPEDDFVASNGKGREIRYGSPSQTPHFQKLNDAVARVRRPGPILCGLEASLPQTLCVNGIQESLPEMVPFPRSMIHRVDSGRRLWIEGLGEAFIDGFRRGILPSEAKVSWARKGRTVDLRDYDFFPGGEIEGEEEGR